MKLFVDPILDPPNDTWKVARSFDDAIDCFKSNSITVLDLSYNLGSFKTGLDILVWIERQLYEKKLEWTRIPSSIKIHSGSSENRQRMLQRIKSIHLYLERPGTSRMTPA